MGLVTHELATQVNYRTSKQRRTTAIPPACHSHFAARKGRGGKREERQWEDSKVGSEGWKEKGGMLMGNWKKRERRVGEGRLMTHEFSA